MKIVRMIPYMAAVAILVALITVGVCFWKRALETALVSTVLVLIALGALLFT